jgi:hypothetical protein
MAAIIMLSCLVLLFVVNANFPFHEYNLWRGPARDFFKKKTINRYYPGMKNKAYQRLNRPLPAAIIIPDGPFYTPDLSLKKVAIVSDSQKRIDNFIINVLKGDPYDFKYLRISCASKVDLLRGEQIIIAHMIYGWDRLPGVELVIDALMKKGAIEFYGDQLYMDL